MFSLLSCYSREWWRAAELGERIKCGMPSTCPSAPYPCFIFLLSFCDTRDRTQSLCTDLHPQSFDYISKQGVVKSLSFPSWIPTCDPPASASRVQRHHRLRGLCLSGHSHGGVPQSPRNLSFQTRWLPTRLGKHKLEKAQILATLSGS